VEEWKWRGTPIWFHGGIVCTGETYKNIVKMTFPKGAALRDGVREARESQPWRLHILVCTAVVEKPAVAATDKPFHKDHVGNLSHLLPSLNRTEDRLVRAS
jgi:hypothetical protein